MNEIYIYIYPRFFLRIIVVKMTTTRIFTGDRWCVRVKKKEGPQNHVQSQVRFLLSKILGGIVDDHPTFNGESLFNRYIKPYYLG